jgi:hypothetical protein
VTPAHRSLLVDFAILLALAAVAVIGYLYSPLLLPKSDVSATPDPGCDLNRGACRARLPDGGQVELSLSPHPIPVVRPMKIQAQISGPAAAAIDRMELDFAGITMNMGYNRVTLSPLGNGRFAGKPHSGLHHRPHELAGHPDRDHRPAADHRSVRIRGPARRRRDDRLRRLNSALPFHHATPKGTS